MLCICCFAIGVLQTIFFAKRFFCKFFFVHRISCREKDLDTQPSLLALYHIFLERESCFKPKQLKFLPKILGEVNAFWAKSHYFGFYCIFINKFFENLSGKRPRGFCVITPLPTHPPSCKPLSEELRIKAPISLHDFKFKIPKLI